MKIALLGDVALFGNDSVDSCDYKEKFSTLKSVLEKYDYIVANLETPLTESSKTIGGKSAYIKGTPDDVEILKYLGISHVALSNNHMFDFCEKGFCDTVQTLESNGIFWFGANSYNCIIENNGIKVALFGYTCYSTNAKGLRRKKPYINAISTSQLETDLKYAKDQNALPIMSFHWGEEHVHYPNYDHIQFARKLCSDKRMVIYGHHPHVIQGIEKKGESVIAYSLGNCCFDDVYTSKSKSPLIKLSDENKESFILELDIEKNTFNYSLVPFSFNDNSYKLEPEIINKIKEYSLFLDVEKEEYNKVRNNALNMYYSNRKKLRDVNWYIRRLRLESIKMICNSYLNKRKYNESIKLYIEENQP